MGRLTLTAALVLASAVALTGCAEGQEYQPQPYDVVEVESNGWTYADSVYGYYDTQLNLHEFGECDYLSFWGSTKVCETEDGVAKFQFRKAKYGPKEAELIIDGYSRLLTCERPFLGGEYICEATE